VTQAIPLRGVSKRYVISPAGRSSRLGEVLSFGKAKRGREVHAEEPEDQQQRPA
jgi:hypothetical protein